MNQNLAIISKKNVTLPKKSPKVINILIFIRLDILQATTSLQYSQIQIFKMNSISFLAISFITKHKLECIQ